MNIMTQLFASRFCSPLPPLSSWRWRVVSATLSQTRFNGSKSDKIGRVASPKSFRVVPSSQMPALALDTETGLI